MNRRLRWTILKVAITYLKYTHFFSMDPWKHEIPYSHGSWYPKLLKNQYVYSWHFMARCCLSIALYWGVSSLFFTLSWSSQVSIECKVSGHQLPSSCSMAELSRQSTSQDPWDQAENPPTAGSTSPLDILFLLLCSAVPTNTPKQYRTPT